jgi:RHS repeat-associated protein
VKLLVDRVEDASASYSSTLHDNDASLLIGANADGSYFDGMIDEVRIATADKSATLGEAEVTYTYNARNQLVTETCGLNVRTYSYDKNGNVTKIAEAVDSTPILTEEMTYDKLNRMVRHEGQTGVEVFSYRGAEWHRYSQASAAGGMSFLYDGDNVLADIDSGVDAFYVTPFLDQNLSITAGGSTYYYSQDGLGSVRTLTDSSGVLKNKYDYLSFGGTHQPGTNVTVEQRYTYTGREKNPESALMYYRYRQYDPRVGRFGGRDPLRASGVADLAVTLRAAGHGDLFRQILRLHADAGGIYSYAANSPAGLVDPLGLQPKGMCRTHFTWTVTHRSRWYSGVPLLSILTGINLVWTRNVYTVIEYNHDWCGIPCNDSQFTSKRYVVRRVRNWLLQGGSPPPDNDPPSPMKKTYWDFFYKTRSECCNRSESAPPSLPSGTGMTGIN